MNLYYKNKKKTLNKRSVIWRSNIRFNMAYTIRSGGGGGGGGGGAGGNGGTVLLVTSNLTPTVFPLNTFQDRVEITDGTNTMVFSSYLYVDASGGDGGLHGLGGTIPLGVLNATSGSIGSDGKDGNDGIAAVIIV
jgi:hypothetical protein